MTFEEFFIKKKIDLRQLKDVEPNLYREFQSHYALMGEKSFDHTKKFWFNRLRKSFRLREDVILPRDKSPETVKPILENNQDEVLEASKVTKPLGFKPRFKAGVSKSGSTETENKPSPPPVNEENTAAAKVPQKETDNTPKTTEAKPLGFKPRFKAGVTKSAPTEAENKSTLPVENKENEAAAKAPQEETDNTPKTTEAKPLGFKPRFKAGVTKSAPTETENKSAPPAENKENETVAKTPQKETDNAPKTTEAKPLGFKPRFKAGVTKSAPTEAVKTKPSPPDEDDNKSKEDATSPLTAQAISADNKETDEKTPPKKLGFTPRFKAKSINKDASKDQDEK